MVNARNLSLAGLATTLVIAVVGVETYNSGVYKTKIDFHGSFGGLNIERGSIYSESTQSCGSLGRAAKGEKVACLENTSTMETRMELSNGLTYTDVNGEASVFVRTEKGYGAAIVGLTLADTDFVAPTIDWEAAKNFDASLESTSQLTQTVEGRVHTIAVGDDKLVFDEVINGAAATHVDFSEENAVVGRSLLAARNTRRALWGAGKKAHNWAKKNKKAVSCGIAMAIAVGTVAVCCTGILTVLGGWIALVLPGVAPFVANACIVMASLPGVQGIAIHCGADAICTLRAAISSYFAC
jgi:hypothetical protein